MRRLLPMLASLFVLLAVACPTQAQGCWSPPPSGQWWSPPSGQWWSPPPSPPCGLTRQEVLLESMADVQTQLPEADALEETGAPAELMAHLRGLMYEAVTLSICASA
jgi:hypothetical protein